MGFELRKSCRRSYRRHAYVLYADGASMHQLYHGTEYHPVVLSHTDEHALRKWLPSRQANSVGGHSGFTVLSLYQVYNYSKDVVCELEEVRVDTRLCKLRLVGACSVLCG